MTIGLYLLIGFGIVLVIFGWIGLRWERERVEIADAEQDEPMEWSGWKYGDRDHE